LSSANTCQVFEYETLIKEQYLDSFGHLNNAAYLVIYEEARWDFITRMGHGLDYVKQNQIGPVILELSVRFKRELKNREKILIQSRVVEVVNSKMFKLEQVILNSEGKVASDALFSVGMFDMVSRKLVAADAGWLAAMGIKEKGPS
jgi:YbgC/YbaW family acyl-CoA thioester hydrolase